MCVYTPVSNNMYLQFSARAASDHKRAPAESLSALHRTVFSCLFLHMHTIGVLARTQTHMHYVRHAYAYVYGVFARAHARITYNLCWSRTSWRVKLNISVRVCVYAERTVCCAARRQYAICACAPRQNDAPQTMMNSFPNAAYRYTITHVCAAHRAGAAPCAQNRPRTPVQISIIQCNNAMHRRFHAPDIAREILH